MRIGPLEEDIYGQRQVMRASLEREAIVKRRLDLGLRHCTPRPIQKTQRGGEAGRRQPTSDAQLFFHQGSNRARLADV